MQLIRTILLLVTAITLGVPGSGWAGSASVVYFSSSATYGVDPTTPDAAAGPDEQVLASNSLLADGEIEFALEFTQSIAEIVDRPDSPSETDPYVVDMDFFITANESLEDAVLSFTRVTLEYQNSTDPVFLPEAVGFQTDCTGLNCDDVDVLLYNDEYYLPSLFLGDLADGESVTRTVRLYIEADMPRNATGGFELPEIGVAGFRTTLDEPLTILLLAAVVGAVVTYRRGRLA